MSRVYETAILLAAKLGPDFKSKLDQAKGQLRLLEKQAKQLNYLGQLRASTDARAVKAAAKLTAALEAQGINTNDLAKAQERLNRQLEITRARAERIRNVRNVRFAAGAVGEAGGKIAARLGGMATTGAIGAAAVGAALAAPLTKFSAFQKAMAETSTVMDDKSALPRITQQVRTLAKEMGVDQVKVANTAWTIFSAGVQDAAKATDVLRTSLKLAVGGSVDAKIAATGIASAVNAYKASALGAADAADIIFKASAIGMAAPEAMATSMGRVTPIASEMGVSFSEVGAALGALTTVMPSTEEAVTELRGILAAIQKPSKEAREEAARLGIHFNSAAVKAKGLSGFLNELARNQKFNGDSATKLFGRVEALAGIMFLAGKNNATFNDALKQMAGRAGAVDGAFAKISNTLEFRAAVAQARVNDLAITFGERLAPAATAALSRIGDWLDKNQGQIQRWADNAGVWMQTRAVPAFNSLIPVLEKLGSLALWATEHATGLAVAWGLFKGLGLVVELVQLGQAVSKMAVAMATLTGATWAGAAAWAAYAAPLLALAGIGIAVNELLTDDAKAIREADAAEFAKDEARRAQVRSLRGGGGGGITVTHSPTITLPPGASRADMDASLAAGRDDLEQRLRKVEAERRRRSFE